MKDIFQDLLGIEGVHGVIVLDVQGALTMSKFADLYQKEESAIDRIDWASFVSPFKNIVEAELIYEQRQIYIRKNQAGFLLVLMDDIASVSMIRLNCEVLLPMLERLKTGSKIGNIFKKKKIF